MNDKIMFGECGICDQGERKWMPCICDDDPDDLLECPMCEGEGTLTPEFTEATKMLDAIFRSDVSQIEAMKLSVLDQMNIPKSKRMFYMKALGLFQEQICAAGDEHGKR